ncbi:MAG: hypothetical protein IJQ67_03035 [Bacilli bacterium]|nr:hypothetical protein [Bacilli bacterium]
MKKTLAKLLFLSLLPISLSSCNGIKGDTLGYFDYGIYPQSLITSTEIINDLNNLTECDEYGYYHYKGNLFVPEIGHPLNDGMKFNDPGIRIVEGEKYWFKVEPVTWDIIQIVDNLYFVTSNIILDCDYFSDNLLTYKDSHIRETIDYMIYDRLFSDKEYEISDTIVEYASFEESDPLNAVDKLFILSYVDLSNSSLGFNADNRRIKVSDYALCKGADHRYWTRSQAVVTDNTNYIYAVDDSGAFVTVDSKEKLGMRLAFKVETSPLVSEV